MTRLVGIGGALLLSLALWLAIGAAVWWMLN